MNLAGLVQDSIVDGAGIRLTLFFQGCPHHCAGCHNPATWDYNVVGTQKTASEILEIFDNNEILSGITFSGGEPLSPNNFSDLLELSKGMKARGKNVWLYTGYTIEDALKVYPGLCFTLFQYLDVIVDGPFKLDQKDLLLKFRGSANQRLIDVKKYLSGAVDFILP